MAVVAVASTAVSVVSQVQQASAQQKAIKASQDQQQKQIQTAEVADMNDASRAQRKQASRIQVAAGESGLSLGSGSIENMLMDSLAQQNLMNGRISTNAGEQIAGSQAQANSMLAQSAGPSLLGAGLQMGLAGATGYMNGSALQIKRQTAAANTGARVAAGS